MEKFRRTPFRCRSCHNRFYVYIPPDKDEVEESAETEETADADTGEPSEEAHDSDVAKSAEP